MCIFGTPHSTHAVRVLPAARPGLRVTLLPVQGPPTLTPDPKAEFGTKAGADGRLLWAVSVPRARNVPALTPPSHPRVLISLFLTDAILLGRKQRTTVTPPYGDLSSLVSDGCRELSFASGPASRGDGPGDRLLSLVLSGPAGPVAVAALPVPAGLRWQLVRGKAACLRRHHCASRVALRRPPLASARSSAHIPGRRTLAQTSLLC